MGARGQRVALLGATGMVGRELLEVLAERRFPVAELLPYATEGSAGSELEFRGELLEVEPLRGGGAWEDCDLVFCAAPGVLDAERLARHPTGARLVDLSGALELDPGVPLHRFGAPGLPAGTRRVAVPRGVVVGVAAVLETLAGEAGLRRASVVTLEPASGVGRAGIDELSEQTLEILRAMTGEAGAAERFPLPLAFDCLPQVGLALGDGETSEEARLRHVVRRWLARPDLVLEVTRVRVPVFSGSLALVHAELARPLAREAARKCLAGRRGLVLCDQGELPTPRTATGRDAIAVGRVRVEAERLALALAQDDLRPGSALAAVEAAEALLAAP
jgi:aspartate-semialdehyde dehydrogenase